LTAYCKKRYNRTKYKDIKFIKGIRIFVEGRFIVFIGHAEKERHAMGERSICAGAVLMAALIGITGCGTIVHGSQQDVRINAPSDAQVKVDDYPTPQKGSVFVNLTRKKGHYVTAASPGKSLDCDTINSKLSNGVLVADILLGLGPILVDAITGAWNNLEPSTVNCHDAGKPSQAGIH
jgi:hypothetical protein